MRATIMALALLAAAAPHTSAENKAVDVTKESGRTAGHAVRDGALTFGHTVRDFFKGGPEAAKRRWKADAARTRENAHEGKQRVKDAAHE